MIMDRWDGFWIIVIGQIIFAILPTLVALLGTGLYWKIAAALYTATAIYHVGDNRLMWTFWAAAALCACLSLQGTLKRH